MPATSPTRVDGELFESARAAGRLQSRSAAQQIAHWARIGRELEAGATVSQREIADVLAGRRSYDDLNNKQQAVVRGSWSERMSEAIEGLDLEAEFAEEGRSWVQLDDDGQVIERPADGASTQMR